MEIGLIYECVLYKKTENLLNTTAYLNYPLCVFTKFIKFLQC